MPSLVAVLSHPVLIPGPVFNGYAYHHNRGRGRNPSGDCLQIDQADKVIRMSNEGHTQITHSTSVS